MQLMSPFDATKFDPTQGVPSMPVGKHPVVIVNDEVKPTKDNTGGYLELTVEIIDGPSKGRQGAIRLNLYNQSQQAVEIAHRQFSAICHCVGVFQVNDGRQLHNLPFMIEVALQKDPEAAKKGYTEVVRYYDRNGNEPGKPGTQGTAAQPQSGGFGGGAGQGQQQPQGGAQAGGWGHGGGQQQPPAGGGQQGGQWGQQGGQQQQPQNPNPQAGGWSQGGGNTGGGGAPWGQRS